MADPDVVATKLRQIEQYHGELREKQELSKETFLADVTERRAVERMFQNVIQACIDLSTHIATTDFERDGDRSRAAVRVLLSEGVIDDETAETLTDAVGFRNVLAHQYGTVRPEQVYTYLQTGLSVYDRFSRDVAAWFENTQSAS